MWVTGGVPVTHLGQEEIFPDPTSQLLADGRRSGVTKALERRINAVVLEGAQVDIHERL